MKNFTKINQDTHYEEELEESFNVGSGWSQPT